MLQHDRGPHLGTMSVVAWTILDQLHMQLPLRTDFNNAY